MLVLMAELEDVNERLETLAERSREKKKCVVK